MYAVVTLDAVIEEHLLLVGTSAQKAELMALTWVLQLTAGVRVNIYMDSKYAFTTIHVHGVLIKKGAKMLSMDKKFWNC
jgi:ribonuclease HI